MVCAHHERTLPRIWRPREDCDGLRGGHGAGAFPGPGLAGRLEGYVKLKKFSIFIKLEVVCSIWKLRTEMKSGFCDEFNIAQHRTPKAIPCQPTSLITCLVKWT